MCSISVTALKAFFHNKALGPDISRSYGVTVSTLDSESSDPSSNLGRTSSFFSTQTKGRELRRKYDELGKLVESQEQFMKNFQSKEKQMLQLSERINSLRELIGMIQNFDFF